MRSCIDQLNIWHRLEPDCEMEIIFTSPGGSVIDGMVLFDYLQVLRRDGHHITTGALGMAASMAGILLQAGDVRWMGREAWVLLHEGSFGAVGTVAQVEDCVPDDHLILMADLSYKPAGDLHVGDCIIAFQEEPSLDRGSPFRRWELAQVTSCAHGLRPCFDVAVVNGDVLRVSEHHPFLTRNAGKLLRWRKADALKPYHDRLSRPAPFETRRQDWEGGFIAGLLDGDGTVGVVSSRQGTGNWRVNFGQNEGPTFERFVNILRADCFTVSVSNYVQEPGTGAHPGNARFRQANIYGLRQVMRLLQRYRPPRLLERFQLIFGEAPPAMVKGIEYLDVERVSPVGEQEVVLLGTSTRTFIGQGYASHNTVEWVKKIQKRILDIFAGRSKVTRSFIQSRWRRKDWWLASDECMKYGFVDEVR